LEKVHLFGAIKKEVLPMRRLALAAILLAALSLAACASGTSTTTGGNSSTITMGSGVFTGGTSITVKAGDAVTFDDTSGGVHQLVIGTNGTFTSVSGAPDQLNNANGLMFNGGDKQTVVFANAGTFKITCKIHPPMQATVTVTQ
jgi:plastocyanin